MDFAAEDAEDYNPSSTSLDPIATLQTLIRVVRGFDYASKICG